MTTLIRKLANNLTSSLKLFLVSICDLVTNVTFKVTQVTQKLHHIKPTGFKVSKGERLEPVVYLTTVIKVVLPQLFENSYGNPITIGDVKNDKK